MRIEELLPYFQGVKRRGDRHYKALCPCHNDHEPSLDILEKDGKILMACPVCEADGRRVMETLRLPVKELFAEQRRSGRGKKPPGVDYLYTDSLKKSRYYVWNGKKHAYKKSFCWYHKRGAEWVKGLPVENGRRMLPPLYKQNNIEWARQRGKVLYLVEGEKDVDTLTQKLRLPAVCSPHGAATAKHPAKKWDAAYNALFTGADVAVIPDNDEAGQAFAQYVSGQLLPVAQSVKVLDLTREWESLKPKGDITDVYESETPGSGKTIAETVAFRLEALTILTAEYVPTAYKETACEETCSSSTDGERNVITRRLSDVSENSDLYKGASPSRGSVTLHPIRESNLANTGNHDSRVQPLWATENKLNEQMYVTEFIRQKQVRCINNKLYSPDGAIEDGKARQIISHDILPYVKTNHGDKSDKLLRSIKTHCYMEPPQPDLEHLHFANGTLSKDENGQFTVFREEKAFCINRFPVQYAPDAPKPARFLRYLNDVFLPDDQITLQQFCGYCLLPTTVLQKALVIIGDGGEGKSVLGTILNGILGDLNCYNESVSVLQSPFGVANVENKLLFIDDDLSESALKNARTFKNLVTNKTTIQAQKKFVQDNPIKPYVRFICFGNFTLQALYDLSEGFQRRQLILQAKPKDPDRADDPFIDRAILENEAGGVLLWLLEGLNALIQNHYQIAVSERTKAQSDSFKQENDSVLLFLNECGDIHIEQNARAHSAALYTAYERFCDDNMLTPLKQRHFLSTIKSKGRKYGIVKLDYPFQLQAGAKRARGFEGIRVNEGYLSVHI